MLDAFLPKGAPFFKLLLEQNAIMCSACDLVSRLLENEILGEVDLRPDVEKLEEEGDAAYMHMIRELSQTFITPIDREDILRIAKEQEGMIDRVHNLIGRLYVFNIVKPPVPMQRLAHNLNEMALLSASMLKGLAVRKDSHDTRAFRALINESEMLISHGLEEVLTGTELTPEAVFTTLKLTRAFDRMEQALHQVIDLAEAIEEAVLKNV